MPWKYRFNHLQFFTVLVFYNFVLSWFHEFGHAIIGLLGKGVIDTIGMAPGVFYVRWSALPVGFWGWLMPFAGGLLVALSCVIMIWASNYEPDVSVAFYCIGMSQFLYGLTEGALWHLDLYQFIQPAGLVAMIAGNIYAVFTAKQMWNLEETT